VQFLGLEIVNGALADENLPLLVNADVSADEDVVGVVVVLAVVRVDGGRSVLDDHVALGDGDAVLEVGLLGIEDVHGDGPGARKLGNQRSPGEQNEQEGVQPAFHQRRGTYVMVLPPAKNEKLGCDG
jgi:hypothetical protein